MHQGRIPARPVCLHGIPGENQLENRMSKTFDFREQTIDMSDQSVSTLKGLGLHDEEGKKININKPLTADQKQLGIIVSFMMTVHPDQADPN